MNEETHADTTQPEDTEGHVVRSKIETDDTEAHRFTGIVTPDGEPDDTEGHATTHKR